jgi:hypothetical protein
MTAIAATYSFQQSRLAQHETLEDALDPNGILSAGKNGIWPGSMREPERDDRARFQWHARSGLCLYDLRFISRRAP